MSVSLTLHICNGVLYKTSKARPPVTPHQKDLLGKTLDDILLHMLLYRLVNHRHWTLGQNRSKGNTYINTWQRVGFTLDLRAADCGEMTWEPRKINNFLWLYSRELDGDSGLPIIIIYCSIFNNILKVITNKQRQAN